MHELYIVISVIICLSIIYTIYYIQTSTTSTSAVNFAHAASNKQPMDTVDFLTTLLGAAPKKNNSPAPKDKKQLQNVGKKFANAVGNALQNAQDKKQLQNVGKKFANAVQNVQDKNQLQNVGKKFANAVENALQNAQDKKQLQNVGKKFATSVENLISKNKNIPKGTQHEIVNNYTKAFNSVTLLNNNINNAVKTLNIKNSSGKLPSDSNYTDLVHNGLVFFNKNKNSWDITQKGKQFSNILTVDKVPVTNKKIYQDVKNTIDQKYNKNNISNAIQTLNLKNSSGTLPKDSNYLDLVKNGIVYFNKKNNSWNVTQKGTQLSGDKTSNFTADNKRLAQAIQTLNAKNSSGQLPTDSTYKDLIHNGLVYFNKDTGTWSVTLKGKQADKQYAVNSIANSIANAADILNGNLDSPTYNDFINNLIKAQITSYQYLTKAASPSSDQISRDITNTLTDYYNSPTDSINPQVVTTLTNYVKQRDLSQFNQMDYQNLINGLVKGVGLGSDTLSPIGQGVNGPITVDNQPISTQDLVANVSNTIARVYANNPQAADINGITQKVVTYLNTKGGNVDASNLGDLVTGLVRGYGIGNGTLSY